ncbi:MAG: lipoyl(octanoyl) transferase LipB [Gammaproteobacteria bacterium]|nr:lipoyl(octanoyl) transferase LipB [Gammaproteobacteria bacterium]
MCELKIRYLGLREYRPVYARMREFNTSRNSTTADEFWCLQHPPVVTLGAHASSQHIHSGLSIPVVPTDRGGQVTYHAPGQVIIYLLVDLRRKALGIRQFVQHMEQAVIDLLDSYQIIAQARTDAHGVYIKDAKVASLGLRVSGGCCYHGVALNVDMDLTPFSLMDPCGFPGLAVTQLRDHGIGSDCQQIHTELAKQLYNQLDYKEADIEVIGQ